MKPAAIIESVLFAAGEPVKLADLAASAGIPKSAIPTLLDELEASSADRGLRVVHDGRTAQLVTSPDAAPYVARFVQAELRGSLSKSALETLAVVAYRGPVTRPEIEAVRGVDSSASLRTLAIRGLVTEVGRRKDPGRPKLYDTTVELLKRLGLSSKKDLPRPAEKTTEKLAALETETA